MRNKTGQKLKHLFFESPPTAQTLIKWSMMCHALFWVLAELRGTNLLWSGQRSRHVPIFIVCKHRSNEKSPKRSVSFPQQSLVWFHKMSPETVNALVCFSLEYTNSVISSTSRRSVSVTMAQLLACGICTITSCFWNQSSHARGHELCHHYIQPQQWGSRAGVAEFTLNGLSNHLETGIFWCIVLRAACCVFSCLCGLVGCFTRAGG